MYVCMYVHKHMYFIYCQISATVQAYTIDYDKGDIPSYRLYLNLRDILKQSVDIPQEYVTYCGVL